MPKTNYQRSLKNQERSLDRRKADRLKKVQRLPARAREGDEVQLRRDNQIYRYLSGSWVQLSVASRQRGARRQPTEVVKETTTTTTVRETPQIVFSSRI